MPFLVNKGAEKMKNYTVEDFIFTKEIAVASGSYQYDINDVSKGKWEINYSNILTKLIQIAGSICHFYASDLFIDWCSLEHELTKREIEKKKILFGFRESGVDHTLYVLNRLNMQASAYSYETTYKAVYMIELYINEYGDLEMKLGEADVKFKKLYDFICTILENALGEDECTDEENEIYSDCANLKCSLESIL